MRRYPVHVPAEAEDPEPRQPLPVIAGGPMAARTAVFAAGEDRRPLVDTAVHRDELPTGMPVAEVSGPAPRYGVEISHHGGHRPLGSGSGGRRTYLGPRDPQRPYRRPASRAAAAPPLPPRPHAVANPRALPAP